jgi:putative membrane protein (TIGR04086 family)
MGTEDIGGGITRTAESRRRIQWLRIVLGGIAAEAGLFIIAIAFYLLPNGTAALLYAVPIACLCMTFLVGFYVARKAQGLFVLHGALVGTVAALIYVALTWGKTLPTAYVISHFLKVIGGASGGFIAGRRRSEK